MTAASTLSVELGVMVAMPDGTRLATDVFRPAGPGRHPVVLLRTPYDRGAAAAFGLQVNALRLVEAGFAVVTQDVRGRFGSQGAFEPFRSEGADGVAAIEWAAEQPWSDGTVAMAGMSYCGYVQALAARERPDALRAWVPAFCPLDARTQWIYDGDAFQLGFNLAWTLASVGGPDRRTPDAARVFDALDAWPSTVRRAPAQQPELLETAAGAIWGEWLTRRDDRAWWDAVSGRGAGAHDAAALVVSGWFDIFHRGSMALHAELAAGAPGRSGRLGLVVGPWDHSPLPLASASGDAEFGWRAIVDLPALTLAWLEHVLRDGPSPLPKAARTFATGANAWLDWDAWPPSASPAQVLHLDPGGRLSAEAPAPPTPESIRFVHDAADPAPATGGRLYPRPRHTRPGQMDQRGREARPDVVSFTAERATVELLVAGPVVARIWSAASVAGPADLAATLVDVAPDGRAVNLAEGVRRRTLAPGEPACFEVDLGHVAHVLRPGHALRLDVAAAAFPRVDRVPLEGRVERTIEFGDGAASRLVLPIV